MIVIITMIVIVVINNNNGNRLPEGGRKMGSEGRRPNHAVEPLYIYIYIYIYTPVLV